MRYRSVWRVLSGRAGAAVAAGLLAAAGLAAGGQAQAAPVGESRIVGGSDAPEGAYPYMAFMRDIRGNFKCGATPISDTWAVTAAHCFKDLTVTRYWDLTTRATNLNDRRTPVRHMILEVIPHPRYNSWLLENDIALVRFDDRGLKQQVLPPADLPPVLGGEATMLGWGGTVTGGPVVPALQHATTTVWPVASCGLDANPLVHVCTFDGTTSTCQGDSGGPLVQNGRLIGITSTGGPTCEPKYASIYTNVSYYRAWIKEKTGV
ncbi:S1 family peptidase [Streptomyces sp. NPDC014746]|uniref:S1 family peptidase n=1 Tax=Streptomyces sp. NPDC014746 TaxID=3364904 RepID=UPI0036F8C9DB